MNAPDFRELQLPPHSVEAEQALLGALLVDPKSWDLIADSISEADFYRDDHRRIFRHIARLCNAGTAFDVVVVFESIERSNEVDQTGGLGYLGEIANAQPSSAAIRQHARVIRDRAALRRLCVIAGQLESACFSPGAKTAAQLIEETEQRLSEEGDGEVSEPSMLDAAMAEAVEFIEARYASEGPTGLHTGFDDFDKLTGGLEPGQLVIVAARPSVGKTLFACNIADAVTRSAKKAGFFTLEMTRREIALRIVTANSGIAMHSMRSGKMADDDWDNLTRALGKVHGRGLWIDDKPAVSVGYIRARAKRMKRKHGLDLLVVDYIGLMTGQGDNRNQEIGSISRGLKALAKELHIPIIALAQLNRTVESRSDKRPIMSDLRDSGEIEQDADIIAMLHREALYSDAEQWDGFAELILRKNRNGPLGEIALRFDGARMLFSAWTESFNPRATASSRGSVPGRFRGEAA